MVPSEVIAIDILLEPDERMLRTRKATTHGCGRRFRAALRWMRNTAPRHAVAVFYRRQ